MISEVLPMSKQHAPGAREVVCRFRSMIVCVSRLSLDSQLWHVSVLLLVLNFLFWYAAALFVIWETVWLRWMGVYCCDHA